MHPNADTDFKAKLMAGQSLTNRDRNVLDLLCDLDTQPSGDLDYSGTGVSRSADFPNQHGEGACGEDQGRLDGRFRVDWTLFSGTERGASMSSRGR